MAKNRKRSGRWEKRESRPRPIATRKNGVPVFKYDDRYEPICDALKRMKRATIKQLFAVLKTGNTGILFRTERRVAATIRADRKRNTPRLFERDGPYIVLRSRAPKSRTTYRRARQSARKAPEVADALNAMGELAGRRNRSQGFRVTAAERDAINKLAMARAKSYYTGKGWGVEDVSSRRSYDLHCRRRSKELRVEVKGTTSSGREIVLTRNEVAHAQNNFPRVALFVLADVQLTKRKGAPVASGGNEHVYEPWQLDADRLTPVGFTYALPVEAR